jgi:hypothetical protein
MRERTLPEQGGSPLFTLHAQANWLLAQQVNWQDNATKSGRGAADMIDGAWDLAKAFIDTPTGSIIFGVLVLLLLFRAIRRRVG